MVNQICNKFYHSNIKQTIYHRLLPVYITSVKSIYNYYYHISNFFAYIFMQCAYILHIHIGIISLSPQKMFQTIHSVGCGPNMTDANIFHFSVLIIIIVLFKWIIKTFTKSCFLHLWSVSNIAKTFKEDVS